MKPPLLDSDTVPVHLPLLLLKVEEDTPPITTSSNGANENVFDADTVLLLVVVHSTSPGDTLVGMLPRFINGKNGLGSVMNLELWERKRMGSHFSRFLGAAAAAGFLFLFLLLLLAFAFAGASCSSLGALASSGMRGRLGQGLENESTKGASKRR